MALTADKVRQYVTQDPHTLDPDLLGKPLASPWKRLIALAVDLIIVSLISQLSTPLLFVGLSFLFFKMTSKNGHEIGFFQNSHSSLFLRLLRLVLRTLVILLLIGTVIFALVDTIETYSGNSFHFVQQPRPSPNELQGHQVGVEQPKEVTLSLWESISQNNYSLLSLIKSFFNDIGLSFGWGALYFTYCLSLFNGKTLGKRLMKIRVVSYDNSAISFWASFSRYSGYAAGLATGLLGFLQIFWDDNRQTIQDKIAGTVVVDLKKERISVDN